jgi:hypothetical protein
LNIKNSLPINLLGWLPEDDKIREFDFYSKSFHDFPDTAMTNKIVKHIIEDLHI